MELSFESIRAIVANTQLIGQYLVVEFKAENQLNPLQVNVTIPYDQDKSMKQMKKAMVKQGAIALFFSSISSVVRSFFPGTAGSLAGGAVSTAGGVASMSSMSNMGQIQITEEERQELILKAFETVKQQFNYDDSVEKWSFITK